MVTVARRSVIFRIAFLVLLIATMTAAAPPRSDPPCKPNLRYPRRPEYTCGENVFAYDFIPGIASISAITFGPDGLLYFARPATSEIVRVQADKSGFISTNNPERQVFGTNLPESPYGLTYYDGAWYVSSDTMITRLWDTDGDGIADEQQVIVSGLPGGVGGWLGNLHVGPDKRLYVAKAASCEACTESDPRRAALLSFALDGSDMRIVAVGLHDSYDFTWDPDGNLYIVDNERANLPGELNVIPNGTNTNKPLDFGWPRCDGNGQPVLDLPEGVAAGDCTQTIKPIVKFAPGSHPTGIVYYDKDTFPQWKGSLLVALGGSWNALVTAGYTVVTVKRNSVKPDEYDVRQLIPDPANTNDFPEAAIALRYLSFYPDHLIGLAVSPEGWLYVSVVEGRIIRFRKAD